VPHQVPRQAEGSVAEVDPFRTMVGEGVPARLAEEGDTIPQWSKPARSVNVLRIAHTSQCLPDIATGAGAVSVTGQVRLLVDLHSAHNQLS
jgi:hypothetical protein